MPPTSWTEWEDREGFRETLLSRFTNPEDQQALRRLGVMLYDFTLEAPRDLEATETSTGTEVVAALAELRFLTSFLASVGREREVSSLSDRDSALSFVAGQVSQALLGLAVWLEKEMGRCQASPESVIPHGIGGPDPVVLDGESGVLLKALLEVAGDAVRFVPEKISPALTSRDIRSELERAVGALRERLKGTPAWVVL